MQRSALAGKFYRSAPQHSSRASARPIGGAGHDSVSAGLFVTRPNEVLLAHRGGPFFATKDDGVWSLPCGRVNDDEGVLAAAKRHFVDLLGVRCPDAAAHELGFVTLRSGTMLHGYWVRGDLDVGALAGSRFSLEWPPASGRHEQFPEIDRVAWFDFETARRKLTAAQHPLLHRLVSHCAPASAAKRAL